MAVALPGSVWLVTGASRGIGLQLVTQLVQHDKECTVIAGARQPDRAQELQALAKQHGERVLLLQLDTSVEDSIKAAARWVESNVGRLDVLVNNAGVAEVTLHPWEESDMDESVHILRVNVLGPLMLSAAMLPLIRSSPAKHKAVINISSIMGSIAHTVNECQPDILSWAKHIEDGKRGEAPKRPSGWDLACTVYRASKAALNTEMLIMARGLAADNIIVVSLHPGWCTTDMGSSLGKQIGIEGMGPNVSPEQSAQGLLNVIKKLQLKDSGSYLTWEGKPLNW